MPRNVKPGWGAAGADTDAESARTDDSARQALFALKVMADRGLIPPEEYERRRAAILKEGG